MLWRRRVPIGPRRLVIDAGEDYHRGNRHFPIGADRDKRRDILAACTALFVLGLCPARPNNAFLPRVTRREPAFIHPIHPIRI